jgi:hypothetical protein
MVLMSPMEGGLAQPRSLELRGLHVFEAHTLLHFLSVESNTYVVVNQFYVEVRWLAFERLLNLLMLRQSICLMTFMMLATNV